MSKKKMETRRMLVAEMLDRGTGPTEVADLSEVTPSAASQGRKDYREKGREEGQPSVAHPASHRV
ncbi:MAG: hypothetical protein ACOC0A_04190 [Planctomycetota bacterium]